MKVDSKDIVAPEATGRVTADRAGATDAGSAARRAAEASVVSSTVAETRAAAARDRVVRVSQLRDAIRQGTYRPDPGAIAQQILNDAELTAQLMAMLEH